VDDGSTDDTAERIKKYGDRIRYFSQANRGQASALNLGFDQARGEIVALLDADDIWLPGKIRKVAEAFDEHPDGGLVYHPSEIWDVETGRCLEDSHERTLNGYLPERPRDLLSFRGSSTSGQAFLRANIRTLLPIPEGLRYYADSYLMYLSAIVAPVWMIEAYLTRYRLHGQNFAGTRTPEKAQARSRYVYVRRAVDEIKAWLLANGYDLQRPELADYMKRHELWADEIRIAAEGASRAELLRHFIEEQKLFGGIWPIKQRVYRTARMAAVVVLGEQIWQNVSKYVRKVFRARLVQNGAGKHAAVNGATLRPLERETR
jgi:glycosyltransferase involved in cell wall biosynthesis